VTADTFVQDQRVKGQGHSIRKATQIYDENVYQIFLFI